MMASCSIKAALGLKNWKRKCCMEEHIGLAACIPFVLWEDSIYNYYLNSLMLYWIYLFLIH
jgi:hypothetical protein